jgi:hypothetical protein
LQTPPATALPFFHQPYRYAPLPDARNELQRSIQRVNHPDSPLFQARKVIRTLFRKPSFSFAKKHLSQNPVCSPVSLGDRPTA